MTALNAIVHRILRGSGRVRRGVSSSAAGWVSFALALAAAANPGLATDAPGASAESGPVVQWWTSSEDLEARMTPQPDLQFRLRPGSGKGNIRVDDSTTYQSVLGLRRLSPTSGTGRVATMPG